MRLAELGGERQGGEGGEEAERVVVEGEGGG